MYYYKLSFLPCYNIGSSRAPSEAITTDYFLGELQGLSYTSQTTLGEKESDLTKITRDRPDPTSAERQRKPTATLSRLKIIVENITVH